MTGSGYHRGERIVQLRANTGDVAERMSRTLRPEMPATAREFLAQQRMVVIGANDGDGRMWTTMLTGNPGFAHSTGPGTMTIEATPAPGDPLHAALDMEAPIGMIAIDFPKRRRMRMNGRGRLVGGRLDVTLDQVYANCPKYIQRREPRVATPPAAREAPVRTAELTATQRALIETADTFFVATADEAGNADCSHRGGNPGFVRTPSPRRLSWPDYAGNGMFNTLGNLELNPAAGLLFVDWAAGRCLQLTGKAHVEWTPSRFAAIPGAQRLIEFEIAEVLDTADGSPLRWTAPLYSPSNPDTTVSAPE